MTTSRCSGAPRSARRLRVLAPALAAAALLASAASLAQQPQRPLRYNKSTILVQPRAGLSAAELEKVLKPHGARSARHLRSINVHVIRLPDRADEIEAVRAMARDRRLKFAELDLALSPGFAPNDPNYSNAWHLGTLGAPSAWDSAQGDGVTLAICDTGVDPAHPDLALVPGYNVYDNNADSRDVYGHGTRVAGAAAMVGQNGVGGAGISFRSKIMPIRVTDTSGYAYYSTIASCITLAADNGARGANASFLGVCGSGTIQSAANYLRSKGGVFTGSGGNTGFEEAIGPSDAVTCVAATDDADNRASWSSYGGYIDVAAPGVGVFTTERGGSYSSASGTSFSAPIALGVYALMMSANPSLPPATLDSILFATARDLGTTGKDSYYGYGRIDAAAAVARARSTSAGDRTPPTIAITSPTGGTVEGVVAVDVAATDAGGVARVELLVNGAKLADDTVFPYGFAWDTSGLPDGPASLQARAYDTAGNVATSSTLSVKIANDKIPPTVAFGSPAAGSAVSGTVAVSVSASDNNKVSKTILLIDGREVAVAYGPSLNYSWNTGGGKPGKGKGKNQAGTTTTWSTLTARAEDPGGNVGTASVTVNRQ